MPDLRMRPSALGFCGKVGLILVVTVSSASLSVQAQDSGRETPESKPSRTEVFAETTFAGVLFIDGTYVAAPYRVSATEDSMTINEIPIPWQPSLENLAYDGNGDGAIGGMPDMGDRSSGNRRRRGRPRRAGSIQVAREIFDRLDSNSVMVAFRDIPAREIAGGSEQVSLYQALLASPPSAEQLQEALALVNLPAEKEAYRDWIHTFQPSPAVRAFMQEEIDQTLLSEQEGLDKAAAMMRLDRFSYPLTLAGMLLGVIALGHMLQWTGRSLVTDHGENCSPESVRCAEVALLLMLGMSVVDLLWTILAGQAGLMKELNPLAAQFLHSPVQLAAFKVTATMLGCGILFAIRARKHGQTAVWWMCLVCVLVTFRWVMFDSMTA